MQGKTGVWIKLPIEHANLVEATVKVNTGFQIYYYYFITTNWLILKGGFYLFNLYLLLFFNIYLKKIQLIFHNKLTYFILRSNDTTIPKKN